MMLSKHATRWNPDFDFPQTILSDTKRTLFVCIRTVTRSGIICLMRGKLVMIISKHTTQWNHDFASP